MRILLWMGLMFGCAFSVAVAQNAENKQKDFDEQIARVRKGDPSIDFGKLRMLFTELPSYKGGDSLKKKEMYDLLSRGDNAKALELAQKELGTNYLSIVGHMVAMVASEKLKYIPAFTHHRYVVTGIIDSIEASGDGKSIDTAFKVISVDEEYALLRIYGRRSLRQSLQHVGGHAFDVLTVMDSETKSEQQIYFNIDPVWAAEKKLFGK